MRFFDEKFRENKRYYIFQSLLAGVAVVAALAFFDVVKQPVIIASFGASAFLAFTIPHRETSSPRHLIGGYIVGIIVGSLLHFVTTIETGDYFVQKYCYIASGAIAVALAMFIMAVTDTEHPPAASIALGFVINKWEPSVVVFVLLGISIISAIKTLLKPALKDIL